ncbi:MAG: hypothetical protein ABR587_04940 [Candidatus Binatia bacterium]
MQRPGVLAAALLVAGLTVAVAAPSLRYDFVYDDEALILERKPFWELGASAFLQSAPWVTGRHLTAVSLDLDRLGTRGKPDAFAFHRTNLLVASLLSVMVLAFALRLGLSLPAATMAAAIFAVHPTHVDAVVSIVGRAELLAAAGTLAVLLICVRPRTGGATAGGAWVALGSAVFGTLAMHSKESALALPLLVVLARGVLGSRVAWLPALAGCGVAMLGWLAVTGASMASVDRTQFVDNPLVYAPILERIPKALAVLWHYALLLVWPHPLLLDRSFAETNPSLVAGWMAALAWTAAAAALWTFRRRAPLVVFALAWFPVSFAITANVAKPIGTMMAERVLLLPSLSVCLLAGLAVGSLARTRGGRLAAVLVVAVVVAVLFGLYRERAAPWQNGDVYFAASAAGSPRSAKAQYDYGNWMLRKGNREEAEAAYARALAIVPDFSRAASYRAESMARRGDAGGGADVYLAYLAHSPEDWGAVTNVTRLLLDAGRPEEAVDWARRLVTLRPEDPLSIDTLVLAETAARRARERAGSAAAPESR